MNFGLRVGSKRKTRETRIGGFVGGGAVEQKRKSESGAIWRMGWTLRKRLS